MNKKVLLSSLVLVLCLALMPAVSLLSAQQGDECTQTVENSLFGSGLTMVLFGGAAMTNVVNRSADDEPPTLEAQNISGNTINLRAGAGTTYPIVGTVRPNAPLMVDGRSEAGDWVRVRLNESAAWVFTRLLRVDGSVQTLNVLPGNDLTLAGIYDRTFNLTVTPGDANCAEGASGLLMQMDGNTPMRMLVNGVGLVFDKATVLVQAQPEQTMNIHILDGSVRVTANNVPVTAEMGASVEVALGGADGLEAVAEPVVVPAYQFSVVENAPLSLLPDTELVCVAGVSEDDAQTTLLSGPGDDYSALMTFSPDTHYVVTGQLEDANGAWWQLDTGRQTAWVSQDAVRTLGLCGKVQQVEAPPLMSQVETNQSQPQNADVSFVPAGQSVWMANTGLDNMTGTCSTPPLALCSHLTAISVNPDGTLSWRGQEPAAYIMSPNGMNRWTFNGRNKLGNGNVSMDITFTSETEWTMTMVTVFDNDTQCNHTFYYTATRQW